MYTSKTRKEKFSGRSENYQQNVTNLAGSSRPPGQPQKRPEDRTSNAGVAVWTADGSRQTAKSHVHNCCNKRKRCRQLWYSHHDVPSVTSSWTAFFANVTLSSMLLCLSVASPPTCRITIDKFRSASLCLLCPQNTTIEMVSAAQADAAIKHNMFWYLTILCSQAWSATVGLDICPRTADVRDSCFRGRAGARGGKPPVT